MHEAHSKELSDDRVSDNNVLAAAQNINDFSGHKSSRANFFFYTIHSIALNQWGKLAGVRRELRRHVA